MVLISNACSQFFLTVPTSFYLAFECLGLPERSSALGVFAKRS